MTLELRGQVWRCDPPRGATFGTWLRFQGHRGGAIGALAKRIRFMRDWPRRAESASEIDAARFGLDPAAIRAAFTLYRSLPHMPSWHVSHLTSNVKGDLDVDLTPLTLVVGLNGSHKSGLVASLVLPLVGAAEDVGKSGAALMELAPAGSKALFSQIAVECGEDGRESVRYEVTGSTAKASKPARSPQVVAGTGIDQLAACLVDETTSLFRAEPKRQREAILSIVAPESLEALVRQEVPSAYLPALEKLLFEVRADTDAERMAALAELVRSCVRELQAAARKAPDGLRPSAPTPDDVSQRIAQAAEARGRQERRASIEAARARRVALAAEVDAWRADLVSLGAKVMQAAARGGGASPQTIASAQAKLSAWRTVLDATIESAKRASPVCFCCRRPIANEEINGAMGEWEKRKARVEAAAEEVRSNEALATAEGRFASCQERVERLSAELAAVDALANEAPFDFEDVSVLDAAVSTALRLQAEQKAWDAARASAESAKAQIDVFKAIEKSVNAVVAQGLVESVEAFEREATAMLGEEGWRVRVQVYDGRRVDCRVGLELPSVGFRSWRALSGAQRAQLVAAFAAAWAKRRSEPVRLVVIDDVWLDSNSLVSLCSGMAQARVAGGPTQVIVCAVEVAPEALARIQSFGWSVVRV